MKLKDKIVQSVKWLFIAQISSQVIRTIVTILVIRDFDAREMTYVALSQSIIGFFEMFSTLGLGSAIVRQKDVSKQELQDIFGVVLAINLFLLLLVFGGADYFSQFYNTPEIANILKVTAISFVFVALGFIPGAMLTKEMHFKMISSIQVVSGLGGALTSYICAKKGLGYWSLVYGGISISLIGTVLKIAVSRTSVWPRFTYSGFVKNIQFGGYTMGCGIAWYSFVTLDVVIAGKFWSAETLGIYALAIQVVSVPLNRTLPLLKSVALPAFSRSMIQDISLLESHTVKGLRLSLLFSVPMFWGAAATAALLVQVFLGEKWLPVILPMAFLCISAPFKFLLELLGSPVFVAGYLKELFTSTVFISIIMLMFYFTIVLNSTNPSHLAAVWMLIYPALALYISYRYCRLLNIRFMAIIKGISSAFTSGLIMLLVILSLVLNLMDTLNHMLLLGLAVVTGALVYAGSLYITDRSAILELLSMYRSSRNTAKA